MKERRESPIKRVNPSGREVWIARYTGPDGKRRSAGTYKLKRDAQAAINQAYAEAAQGPAKGRQTVGGYFEVWLDRHPRTARTERSYDQRVRAVLDVPLDRRLLRDWPLDELKRGHALDLLDHLLTQQGRAAKGAKGILVVLSALAENAIDDGHANSNPFKGVKVRAGDKRIQKAPRAPQVWTKEQMRELAAAAGPYEPMIRVLSDCGLRLGEMLALERRHWHGDTLEVRQTVHMQRILEGTKTDHGKANAGRVVPVAPGLRALLDGMPKRIDSPFLFPNSKGKPWDERGWYRRVWEPARTASGVEARPHDLRHSWVSHMLAAGVDPADVAAIAGHSVGTMLSVYTHALHLSYDAIREAVG